MSPILQNTEIRKLLSDRSNFIDGLNPNQSNNSRQKINLKKIITSGASMSMDSGSNLGVKMNTAEIKGVFK